jgi:hypothetical protein
VKLGTEDKKKTYIAVALFALAVLAITYVLWPSSSPAPVAQEPATAPGPSTAGAKGQHVAPVFSKLDPSLRLDLLKGSEEVAYKGSGRDIFRAQAEPKTEVGKAPDQGVPTTPVQTEPPPNPPIPLKFYGFASTENRKQIFLSQGEDIFVAREGDIVKGRYKVVHVNPNNVEIQDVLGNYSQSIPLTLPNS